MQIFIDISNYYESRAHTGIQRVVREFLFRLIQNNKSIKYNIVYYDVNIQKFVLVNAKEVVAFLNDVKNYEIKDISTNISIDDISSGDLFFDMDGVWNHGLKRTYLYKKLKNNGVLIYNFIYDLVPILKPQFSHENTIRNFVTYLYAIYQYSDMVIFDSRSAEKDFLDIKDQIGNRRNISTRVIKLGSDISLNKSKIDTSQNIDLLNKKYILFVGTIEPRKNQKLMLEVFEKLEEKHSDLHLIFIGKEGWNNHGLINKLKNHKLLNKKLHWLSGITDEELAMFYANAYIVTYLSEYEGFGLPIAESLNYGKITITSKNSSMYEVGKNFADYIVYNSFNELYEILDLYLKDTTLYELKQRKIKKEYVPYFWDTMYSSLVDIFSKREKNINIQAPEKLQFVFISIDAEKLKGTIEAIDKYIDFVKEYIIVTRKNMIPYFKKIKSSHKLTIVDENKVLGKYAKGFAKRDHQSKNWLLRVSLLSLDRLDNQFIMLDDDNRPLRKIEIEHFIQDGKYNAYYFFDLLYWNKFETEYDQGQHNMKCILDKDALELLSYSSHKPQIIDKKLFKEVVEKYFAIGLEKPIDEWSIYFNYVVSKYPFLFNKIKYDTLNWPGTPADWEQLYIPDEYNFENYYETNYKGNYNEKIEYNKQQIEPYLLNKKDMLKNKEVYREQNMVHGVLLFKQENKRVILAGVPYFISANQKSWVKLIINYKAINILDNVKVMYYINGGKGHFTSLKVTENFEDNVFEFPISCKSLTKGEYDLLIDVYIDERPTYGLESPYLVKLFVK